MFAMERESVASKVEGDDGSGNRGKNPGELQDRPEPANPQAVGKTRSWRAVLKRARATLGHKQGTKWIADLQVPAMM
jgi:hypothetical protein